MTSQGSLPVALDAMGGDHAPDALVEGARRAVARGLSVVLVGDQSRLAPLVGKADLPIVHAPDVVDMGAGPAAIRRLPDSSVRVGLRLLNGPDPRAGAFVSAGNTGAVLVGAMIELGTLPGVQRPAIAAGLPTATGGEVLLVDAGASADARPEHFVTYALLGEALARCDGVAQPRVGLLSNGTEPNKGRRMVREAHELLLELPLQFVGNVEPLDVLSGAVDVVVCDGFTGNILLKTAEAMLSVGRQRLRGVASSSWRAAAGAWALRPALRDLAASLDWERKGAALLAGMRSGVWITHGSATAGAVDAAIERAHYAQRQGLIQALSASLHSSSGASSAPSGASPSSSGAPPA